MCHYWAIPMIPVVNVKFKYLAKKFELGYKLKTGIPLQKSFLLPALALYFHSRQLFDVDRRRNVKFKILNFPFWSRNSAHMGHNLILRKFCWTFSIFDWWLTYVKWVVSDSTKKRREAKDPQVNSKLYPISFAWVSTFQHSRSKLDSDYHLDCFCHRTWTKFE